MKKKFFYGKQLIDKKDIVSVLNSLKSEIISQGSELKKLEKRVAKYCGAKYCLAVSSGTAGLHLAVSSLNLEKNFLGLTSPITFAATPNAILLSGGKFNLIDIDINTFNIDHNCYEDYIKKRKKQKMKMPKLVIPVSLGGISPNMKKIYEISKKNNIKVIEDASQSMGGIYNKKKIGRCDYADLTVFSLHPVKSITSGEGGLVLTNNKKLYEKMKLMRVNGMERNQGPTWKYDVKCLGLNYKISEINCSLANSQLNKIDFFLKKRKSISDFYKKNLNSEAFEYQKVDKTSKSAWHLFIVKFKKKISKNMKSKFFDKLQKKNIYLDIKYRPLQTFSYYKKKFKLNSCPNSLKYFSQTFCLPIYPSLKLNDVKYIVKNVNIAFKDLNY